MKPRKILTIAVLLLPVLFVLALLISLSMNIKWYREELQSELTLSDKARIEKEQKHFTNAEQLYREALQANPDDITALLGLSELYLLRGDQQKSLELLAPYSSTSDPRLLTAIASVYYNSGAKAEAIEHARRAYQIAPQSKEAVILLLQSFNSSNELTALQEFLTGLDLSSYDTEVRFLGLISTVNTENISAVDFSTVAGSVPDNLQQLITIYQDNLPLLSDPEQSFTAKANIVYGLIRTELFEYALPFAEDMAEINRFYENSLLYRSIVYIHLNDLSGARNDLELLERYYPGKLATRVLELEVAVAQDDEAGALNLLGAITESYQDSEHAKYLEAFKILYKYHKYELYQNLFSQIGGRLSDESAEINYMALKVNVYLKNYPLLPALIDRLYLDENLLNLSQRAVLTSTQALVAYQNSDMVKAELLLNTADELYIYSPFVQYIKSIVYQDNSYLERAYELDLESEIPGAI